MTTSIDDASGLFGGEIDARATSAGRRAYATPMLKVYGPFDELTARVGFRSATSDGGFLNWVKTK